MKDLMINNMQPTAVSRAIADSIKGGWNPWFNYMKIDREVGFKDLFVRMYGAIFLDKAFWVALGKARGWDKKIVVRRGTVIGNFCAPPNSGNRGECFEEMGFGMDYIPAWMYYWHRFIIDALAQNKTPEQFFLSLEGNEV